MEKKRKKYKALTIEEKVKLLHYLENHSQNEASRHFEIGIGTVNRTSQQKDELLNRYYGNDVSMKQRRVRHTQNDDINKDMLEWFKRARQASVELSDSATELISQALLEKVSEVTNTVIDPDSLNFDDHLIVASTTTNPIEIVDEILEEENFEESNIVLTETGEEMLEVEVEQVKCPSINEVKNAINLIKIFALEKCDSMLDGVQKLEDSVLEMVVNRSCGTHQSVITDFFNKKP
ncbi:tigger transposable element derived 6-like protein [Leptotrombidium deliense]|uniref:Tigger transposable element derived 6-like protein n=1 Tax=Leptotrombidium deliense TaxID=299467 RepID=A0A443S3K6_9ACAR|nr:tigger transposable element derived 6-like protein [Leptotrombidium deliense]